MIKIGWAEEEFSFTKPISLVGQFAERISEYIEKPLTITAFAVDSGQEQMVLCSADLVGVSFKLIDNVRNHLKNNTAGLDPEKVIICATHTHTGPGYAGRGARLTEMESISIRNLLESQLPPNKRYVENVNISENSEIMNKNELLELLSLQMSKAALRAWNDRKAGAFSNAFGRAAVGMCRRAVYNDNSAQMWGDTNRAVFTRLEGGNDSGIELIYVFDGQNNLTGIVANLACPAQCVQHRKFVSPDFWGETKKILRKHFGEHLFLLPLCGAAGDQCPVDLIRWVEPESDVNDPNLKRFSPPKRKADPSMFDISGMKKAGKRIANEIIEVYNEGLEEPCAKAEFVHKVYNMQLPLRRATLTEEKAARAEIHKYLQNKPGDVDFNDAANLQVHLGILRRMELQEKTDLINIEVHIVRLGNIAIATNPFELFLDYGNQIKARSRAEQTLIIQLANGVEGYLPTAEAESGGHYSAFISSGQVGHAGGELLVRQTLKSISGMFGEIES